MHVIARRTLVEFWERHAAARGPLQAWFAEARHAQWSSPAEILARYHRADVLSDDRIVFNIGGNRFRLVARINYRSGTVFIRFVGTHAEYDRIDAEVI